METPPPQDVQGVGGTTFILATFLEAIKVNPSAMFQTLQLSSDLLQDLYERLRAANDDLHNMKIVNQNLENMVERLHRRQMQSELELEKQKGENPHMSAPHDENIHDNTKLETNLEPDKINSDALVLARINNLRKPDCFAGDRSKWVAFEDHMTSNLKIAEPLYPTESDKLQYLKMSLDGTPHELLHIRTQPDQPNRITTLGDALRFLRNKYYPFELVNQAENNLHTLRMDDKDSFDEFFTEFQKLSFQLRLDEQAQLTILRGKLAPRLHRTTHGKWNYGSLTEAEFDLRNIDSDQRAYFLQQGARRTARINPARSLTSVGPDRSFLMPGNREYVKKERHCFYCRKEGHIARECTERTARQSRTQPATMSIISSVSPSESISAANTPETQLSTDAQGKGKP
jgi:hypothetical protein